MADVVHRITKEFRRSVTDSEFDPTEWLFNPDTSSVQHLPWKYWIIENDALRPATAEEQAEIDRLELEGA